MDGEARTSTAIYFHVNNARVNRRGPGREHAHSRLSLSNTSLSNGQGQDDVVADRE